MRVQEGGFARLILPLLVIMAPCVVPERRARAAEPARPIGVRALQRANWGAGRCAATSCHGSPEPVHGARIFRNEHTVWASRDRHAGAFQTLYSNVSRSIAKKLGQHSGRVIPAHQDSRCLACHSTPGPAANPELAATIRQDGVGCESCHGGSERWLGPHTTYDWDQLTAHDKEARYGKVRLDDLTQRAERCVGCHVGAPARNGLPAREVNHDLIAAGHPRLNFELASFLANLPAHWVETGRNRAIDFPARTWAIGQVVSGRAALELLQGRARDAAQAGPDRPSTWPEFAEYDCASCHQDLRSQPPPSSPVVEIAPTRPGIPAWGTWYFPMVSALAEQSPKPDPATVTVGSCLARLRAAMDEPLPDPGKVAGEAGAAAEALDRWLGRLQQDVFDPLMAEQFVHTLRGNGKNRVEPAGPGWDHEAQLYLGLVPLRQSLGAVGRNDPRLLVELQERRGRLVAPFAPTGAPPLGFGAFQPLDDAPGR